jgi:MoaA/NifB/PqqE/SkfB family radical SAM enzyme
MEKISKLELFDGTIATIKDTENYKALISEDYNFFFNKKDGFFVRWGKGDGTEPEKITKQDMDLFILWSAIWKSEGLTFDPKQFVSDLKTDGSETNSLPEILDFEVSTCCFGPSIKSENGKIIKARPCKFCYKSNTNKGSYMSTDDFKKIIDKMPNSLMQCALGIGNVDQPNLFDMMDYLIEKDIKPNITINGDRMTPEIYDGLSSRCGAISISYYDLDLTFNAVYELATIRKMKQINIHFFLSEETFEKGMQLIEDAKKDLRMKDLNAIVFLSAKLRGNAEKNNFHILSQEKYNIIAKKALESGISVGMDSCSAQKTRLAYKDLSNYKNIDQCVEPCESTLYSTYINHSGIFFPCSFSEGIEYAPGDWKNGISVLDCDDFLKDVWFNSKTKVFSDEVRECRKCGKSCPIFEI